MVLILPRTKTARPGTTPRASTRHSICNQSANSKCPSTPNRGIFYSLYEKAAFPKLTRLSRQRQWRSWRWRRRLKTPQELHLRARARARAMHAAFRWAACGVTRSFGLVWFGHKTQDCKSEERRGLDRTRECFGEWAP